MDIEKEPYVDDKNIYGPNIESEIVRYIREQRHDFMNHVQVIWGYLQLGKPDEAMRYISQLNEDLGGYSSIFRLGNPAFSLFLYNYINKACKLGLKVDFETDVDYINNDFNYNYYEELCELNGLFDEVINKTIKTKDKSIYIDLYREDNVLYIAVSNNYFDDCTECLGENDGCLEWPGIENTMEKLHKCGIKVCYKADDSNITVKIALNNKKA